MFRAILRRYSTKFQPAINIIEKSPQLDRKILSSLKVFLETKEDDPLYSFVSASFTENNKLSVLAEIRKNGQNNKVLHRELVFKFYDKDAILNLLPSLLEAFQEIRDEEGILKLLAILEENKSMNSREVMKLVQQAADTIDSEQIRHWIYKVESIDAEPVPRRHVPSKVTNAYNSKHTSVRRDMDNLITNQSEDVILKALFNGVLNCERDFEAVEKLLNKCINTKDYVLLDRVFGKAIQSKASIDVIWYGTIINTFYLAGRYDTGLKYFELYMQNYPIFHKKVAAIGLSCYYCLKNYNKVTEIYSKIKESIVDMDIANVVIQTQIDQGRIQDAVWTYRQTISQVSPNEETFNILIHAIVDMKFFNSETQEIVAKCMALKTFKNTILVSSLIRYHGFIGDWATCEKLYKEHHTNASYRMNIKRALLAAKSLNFPFEDCLQLANRLGFDVKESLCNVWICNFLRKDKLEDAQKLYSYMKEVGIIRSDVVYDGFVSYFCKKGDLEMAEKYLQLNASEKDTKLTAKPFISFIEYYAHKKDLKKALEWADKMEDYRIVKTAAVYSYLMKIGYEMKCYDFVFQIYEESLKKNAPTKSFSFDFLMLSSMEIDDPQGVYQYFLKSTRVSPIPFPPSLSVLDSVAEYFYNKDELEKAESVLQAIRNWNYKMSVAGHTLGLKIYYKTKNINEFKRNHYFMKRHNLERTREVREMAFRVYYETGEYAFAEEEYVQLKAHFNEISEDIETIYSMITRTRK